MNPMSLMGGLVPGMGGCQCGGRGQLMGGGNPMQMLMMQMMQMMMQMLMQQMMMGGVGCGGASMGMPSFGASPVGGCPGGGGGGFSGGGGLPGSGGFLGGGGGPIQSRDSYVPAGYQAGNAGGPMAGGGQGSAAVRWAETQLGVSERGNPDVVRGYSRGRWQAWCADFVSTALKNSGGSAMGHQSSVAGILDWGRRNGKFIDASSARGNPGMLREGDVVVWKQAGRSHVGLVTGVNPDGTFNTIEGNTSDRVARRRHSFNDRALTGFVRAAQ